MMLSAHELTHAYGARRVLSGLSLAVDRGEVVGLLGPNGAGKSTAMSILVGRIRPLSGTVCLNGKPINSLPLWVRVRRGIGYLPQSPSVLRELTVEENLLLAARTEHDAREQVRTLMEERGLAAIANVPSGRLSGGERRKLELSRALVGKPSVLIMDEPFSGVDPVGIESLQAAMGELARSGIGILVSDHAVRATLTVCDRAIILDEGTVMATGCPEEIVANPVVRDRYLGSTFDTEKTI